MDECPNGYVKSSGGWCAKCSDSNLLYYNHSCVSSCPLSTFKAFDDAHNSYECQPCYLGCDSCVNNTLSGCLSCSAGYFYYDNACGRGCPSDMYANPTTRRCEQCQPPCVTCSQPNSWSCTSCPAADFLLNGTCVNSCPDNYYQSFLGQTGVYQVPTCLPKLTLSFNLSLTSEARVININFNYGIVHMILAISQRLQVQIANTVIDNVLYALSPVTESRVKFQYLGDQHYPPLSLLNITIDIDSDYNNDLYEQFTILNKSGTIQLKEIYPFTKVETQVISSSSAATEASGSAVAAVQTVSSVAQGALSLSILRLKLVGELVQMMRFIDIRWPPSIAQFYATSNIDSSSILIPVDFIKPWNDQLEDSNYSISRIFDEYEVSPFFSENYNTEMSNLLIWGPTVVIGSFLLNFLTKHLNKLGQETSFPKPHAKKKNKFRDLVRKYCIIAMQKLSRLANRIDDSVLWNFLLIFTLSIYQAGVQWAFLNIRFSSALLEPSTPSTRASLAVGSIFLGFYILLTISIYKVVSRNLKSVLRTEESLFPKHLKKYESLFFDFNNQKALQLLFVPLSLLRSFIFASVIALLGVSPIAQVVLFWSANTAFIIYYIKYKPLKERWVRIITLIIEILVHGCVTIGLIVGILGEFDAIDASTSEEIGFIFICLSLGSTLGGVILSLIQIVPLVKSIFMYLRELLRKKQKIYPIARLEKQEKSDMIPETANNIIPETVNRDFMELNVESLQSSPFNTRGIVSGERIAMDRKIFESIGNLSPDVFEKIPQGNQLYEELREWWDSFSSRVKRKTDDLDAVSLEKQRNNDSQKLITLDIQKDL